MYICIYLYVYIYIYICAYICIERERERERTDGVAVNRQIFERCGQLYVRVYT